MKIEINSNKIILSSRRRVYKTEGFISSSKKTAYVDAFISRIAEGVILSALPQTKANYKATAASFAVKFYIDGDEIVFFNFESELSDEGGFDRRLADFMLAHPIFTVELENILEGAPEGDGERKYLVSGGDGLVNFPLLNATQRKIVETEDSNMLVQGVAGSGKTNVCVEKIVYCACRNYRGKVLYSTFSRGLLIETKSRVKLFTKNVDAFIADFEAGNVIFADEEHKLAVENKLGIPLSVDGDGDIIAALKRVSAFLSNNVDYMLIEDIYATQFEKREVATEQTFLKNYLGEGRNFKYSGALEKIKNIAPEIIYKEIYGMIFGKFELSAPTEMMSKEDYIKEREQSFTRAECETIYAVACDFLSFLKKRGYTDNNLMSRELLSSAKPIYSVCVIDEVQDFTQVNLCLFKRLSLKLFCVGDALQMINPSYFNFGYLKRLMYGEVTGVSELTHNYRSTQKIESIAQKLGELNVKKFGTHSFVLKGESVHSSLPSSAVFIKEKNFWQFLTDKKYENVTVVVGSQQKKQELRKSLGRIEILTVAEAKGLERNTVILIDVLSDNIEKWNYLQTATLNRKTADENSVFRYYFNLFYVGVSRAKQHLFVAEGAYPPLFEELISTCFEKRGRQNALIYLAEISGKTEMGDEEFIERIENFCRLGQYENARFAADRLSTEEIRDIWLAHIYVHEHFIRFGRERDAGVEYWKRGMDEDAREMFTRSGDTDLFPLMDACKQGGGRLNTDIVKFYPLVGDNEVAKAIILDTLKSDFSSLFEEQKKINEGLKPKRKRQ